MTKENKKAISLALTGAVIFVLIVLFTYEKPVDLPQEQKAEFQPAKEYVEEMMTLVRETRVLVGENLEEEKLESLVGLRDHIKKNSLELSQKLNTLTEGINKIESSSIRKIALDNLIIATLFLSETTDYLEGLNILIDEPDHENIAEVIQFLFKKSSETEKTGEKFIKLVSI